MPRISSQDPLSYTCSFILFTNKYPIDMLRVACYTLTMKATQRTTSPTVTESGGNKMLVLTEIVKKDYGRYASDRRRKVNSVIASYRDAEGFEYRKRFTSYDEPVIPQYGTHADINAMSEQFKGPKMKRKTYVPMGRLSEVENPELCLLKYPKGFGDIEVIHFQSRKALEEFNKKANLHALVKTQVPIGYAIYLHQSDSDARLNQGE